MWCATTEPLLIYLLLSFIYENGWLRQYSGQYDSQNNLLTLLVTSGGLGALGETSACGYHPSSMQATTSIPVWCNLKITGIQSNLPKWLPLTSASICPWYLISIFQSNHCTFSLLYMYVQWIQLWRVFNSISCPVSCDG